MAVGGNTCCEWMKAQGDVARALAEKEGWEYVELSNNNDPGDRAQERADLRAGRRRRRSSSSTARPSSEPGHLGCRSSRPTSPMVTYDIADPGMYFVGIDNLARRHCRWRGARAS